MKYNHFDVFIFLTLLIVYVKWQQIIHFIK